MCSSLPRRIPACLVLAALLPAMAPSGNATSGNTMSGNASSGSTPSDGTMSGSATSVSADPGGTPSGAPAADADADAPADASADPAAAMRLIASEPYRYGGEVSGLPIGDGRMLQLAMGLQGPRPDGALRGWAILFDADRRLVATGPVRGSLTADPAEQGHPPGQGHCSLVFGFPSGDTRLDGLCSAGTVAGEIVSRPLRPGLLRRLAAWWGDGAVTGRAWLDAASFDRQS